MCALRKLASNPALLFCAVLFVASKQVSAQSPEQGQRLLDQRKIEQQEDRAKRGNTGITIQSGDVEKPKQEEKCFPIKSISVSGNKKISQKAIDRVVAENQSKCMGPKEIGALLQLLSKLYIDNGYITSRALTPEQDISSGILKIVIVEGFVEGIEHIVKSDNKSAPGPERKIAGAFPGMQGRILQLRDLEQGLDQINRLPSNTAKVDIKPGNKIGGSILQINNKVEDEIRGTVRTYYSDYGDGQHEARADLILEADDLLDFNDTWFFAYSGGNLSNSFSLSSSVPYGYWLFSASGSYSETLSQLTETSDLFDQAASITVSADRVIFRNSDSKLRGSGSYTYRWSTRHINSIQLSPQTISVVGGQLTYERFLPGAYLSLGAGLDVGIPLFGVPQSVNIKGVPQTEFLKPKITASYYTGWRNGITLYSRILGQYSNDVLLNTEQLFIGGPETIRGYELTSISGEQGIYAQNTLTAPFNLLFGGQSKLQKMAGDIAKYIDRLSGYTFIDAGTVRNIARDEHLSMIGIGGGIRYASKYVTTDLYAAYPLTHSGEISPSEFEIRLSATFKIF